MWNSCHPLEKDCAAVSKDDTPGFAEHAYCIDQLQYCVRKLSIWYEKFKANDLFNSIGEGNHEEQNEQYGAFEALFWDSFVDIDIATDEEQLSDIPPRMPATIDGVDDLLGDNVLTSINFYRSWHSAATVIAESWQRVCNHEISPISATLATNVAIVHIHRLEAELQLRCNRLENRFADYWFGVLTRELFLMEMSNLKEGSLEAELVVVYQTLDIWRTEYDTAQLARDSGTVNGCVYSHYVDNHDYINPSSCFSTFLYYELNKQCTESLENRKGKSRESCEETSNKVDIYHPYEARIEIFMFNRRCISLSLVFACWAHAKSLQLLSTHGLLQKTMYIERMIQRQRRQRLNLDSIPALKEMVAKAKLTTWNEFLSSFNLLNSSEELIQKHYVSNARNPIRSFSLLNAMLLKEQYNMECIHHNIRNWYCHLILHAYHGLRTEGFITEPIAVLEKFINLFKANIFADFENLPTWPNGCERLVVPIVLFKKMIVSFMMHFFYGSRGRMLQLNLVV